MQWPTLWNLDLVEASYWKHERLLKKGTRFMTKDTAGSPEAKDYLRQLKEKRGYLLDYHKVLAGEDLAFLKALGGVLNVAYSSERTLSKKIKELIFIAVLTAVGGPKEIKLHMEIAKKLGVTKEEVLEALEILVLPCGLPRFFIGYEVWAECFDVNRVEPD
jgi:4-carboxymuconolactone decarboxylase